MAETFEVAAWLKSLPCAPEFRPTEAEFADPIAYISKIEAEARTYGICKIIPPFLRASKRTVMANLNRSLLLPPSDSSSSSAAYGSSVCEPELRRSVGICKPLQTGGPHGLSDNSSPPPPPPHPRTRSVPSSFFIEGDDELKAKFNTRRQKLRCITNERSKAPVQTLAQKLVRRSGDSYTLEQFELKAKQFTRAYLKTLKDLPPFVIESLFWRAVADRTVTVEDGNDISGSAFGEPDQLSTRMAPTARLKRKWGFDEENQVHLLQHPVKEPKLNDSGLDKYDNEFSSCYRSSETASSCGASLKGKPSSIFVKERLRPRKMGRTEVGGGLAGSELDSSFWNMKLMPRAPGSLLRYMPDDIPGVTSPVVHIGMLFSMFPWHVDDHELHSLNYLHIGAPKTWYAVPGDAAPALEDVVWVYGYGNPTKSKAAFTLLSKKTTIMSPEYLPAAGVPCCRLVQNAGEFVVTFPRAYHFGFSHGFNCGEAVNFATPAWLEVAKDAATRRAAMDYQPMLSHHQLLYLLALSISPRVPLTLAFEPRSSRSKGTGPSSGEEAVKNVFTDDAAHNNRLLGLLTDSGATDCILLSDRAEISSALSEHSKVSCSAFDKDERTASFTEMVSEVTCEAGIERKHARGFKNHGTRLQELACPPEPCEMQVTTNLSYSWRALPCAACGLLCFPSIVLVQPVSDIGKGSSLAQLDIVDSCSLPSLFLKDEEGHTADTGQPPSLFALTERDLQSDYMRTPLSEAIYHPVAHIKPGSNTSHWEMEQEAIQGCDKDVQDSNRKGLRPDCVVSGGIGNTNVLQHDVEETQNFFDGSFNCQEDVLRGCAATKVVNVEESNGPKSLLQKDKVLFQDSSENAAHASVCKTRTPANISEDHRDIMNLTTQSSGSMLEDSRMLENVLFANHIGRSGHRATETVPATSVLDLLAVTNEDDSRVHGSRKKSISSEAEHGAICFHPHSSLLSNDEVGCTVEAAWHHVNEEAVCVSSACDISKLHSFESNFAAPSSELPDKLFLKEVLLQKADGSYMCPSVQNVETKNASAVSEKAQSPQKEEHSLCLQGGHSCLDMPTGARERFAGSEKVSQVIAQVVGCGKSKEVFRRSLASHFSGDNLRPCTFEIRAPKKHMVLSESSRQVKGLKDGHHNALLADKSATENLGQACSPVMLGTDGVKIVENQILKEKTSINTICKTSTSMDNLFILDYHGTHAFSQHTCLKGTSNAYVDANLYSSANWMRIEARDIGAHSMFEESSTLENNKRSVREQKFRVETESDNLGMENAGIWKRLARDRTCSEAPYTCLDYPPSSNTSRPRFLCLEHALEAHHQLKLRGGSRMLIICHSDIARIESHARHFAEELSLTHAWRSIPYSEATQEQKHLVDWAMKAEEEGEDNSEDWVAQLGMSVRHREKTALSNFSNCFDEAEISCEVNPEPLHSLHGAREDVIAGKGATNKKVSVAGRWCGKVWMNDQVHPALGGCYNAQLQLQALQNIGRDTTNNVKSLSIKRTNLGTFKDVDECAEETNLINSHVNAGFHPDTVDGIERTNKKSRVFDRTIHPLRADLDNKRRELACDIATLDTSCLTSAARKRSNSFEELINFANQEAREDCYTLQLSNDNTSMSNEGKSPVSDVDMVDHDCPDMDIWQDLDVGCYAQEVLSFDTIGGVRVNDPLMVEACHEFDTEAQEDLIPSMLRSCSPFDCADFFCEGPSTRLRSRRSVPKAASIDDDDVVNKVQRYCSNPKVRVPDPTLAVNGRRTEALFGSGKRHKQPRQKPKKQVMNDLEEECDAYICELDGCSMSFSSKQELSLHKRNTCTFLGCGKRFGSHKYLLQHRRVHLDDRPLKCPWKGCKMTFKWKWACTEHYRVHTGERPYVCPIPECGQTFRFVSDFSRHKRKTGHTK